MTNRGETMTDTATQPIYEATDEELTLAQDWHGGQASMLYAVASTGALTRGSMQPIYVDTDEEWNAALLHTLIRELTTCEMVDYPDDDEVRDEWIAKLDALTEDCDIVGHDWGDITRSRWAGTVHRPCARCRAITLDLSDEGDR